MFHRSVEVVYAVLYEVPLQRRISRDWVLELDRQERAMRRMLAFVFDSVTDRIISYLDAGPDSNLCFWILQKSKKIGPDNSRHAAAMLDLRWHVPWDVGVMLRQQFWHVHLGRARYHLGHSASWKKALVEIWDFLSFHSRMLQRGERAQHKLRSLFEDVLCDQNACNRWSVASAVYVRHVQSM